MNEHYRSEIRDSVIRDLLERVKKQKFGHYLQAMRLEKIRMFRGAEIRFDFPVTALIGPNGGGKSTILFAAGSIYNSIDPKILFRKSRVGDTSMDNWLIEYELVSKDKNPKGTIREVVSFEDNKWNRSLAFDRPVKHIGIARTLPAGDNPLFALKNRLWVHGKLKNGHHAINETSVENINNIKAEAEKILGKSLSSFKLIEVEFVAHREKRARVHRKVESRENAGADRELVTYKNIDIPREITTLTARQRLYVGGDGAISYSEFSFGAGEGSIIHLISDIETSPDGALVLIDEIENGLHPLAVCRLVDYLISVADRKRLQILFTTHSDYALASLPSEAIWASMDGRVQQGKLSIEVLRVVSGRVDKRLAIFVEDDFAKQWVEAIIRDRLSTNFEEIGVYALHGDGIAYSTHIAHSKNPAVSFRSMCILDGDSQQLSDDSLFVSRLPGTMPELSVFNDVVSNIENNVALLTVACQLPLQKQALLRSVINDVSKTNRDSHLLFAQVGEKLGFLPAATVSGAFLAVWSSERVEAVDAISSAINRALEGKRIAEEVRS